MQRNNIEKINTALGNVKSNISYSSSSNINKVKEELKVVVEKPIIDTSILKEGYHYLILDNKTLSLSIKILVPYSFDNFKSFIEDYINEEREYKLLYDNLKKKVYSLVKDNLSLLKGEDINSDDSSHHHNPLVLFEYLVEIWTKLDISYKSRYSVLEIINRSSLSDIVSFLDKETKGITEYFKETEGTINDIREKEKIKYDINKTKVNQVYCEKISLLNRQIKEKMNRLKEENIIVIWKGIPYEYLLEYEQWMERK